MEQKRPEESLKKSAPSRGKLRLLNPILWTQRIVKYVYYRILRYPGTPYSIAAGFASGAAISFTPLPGLHFLLGALLAWVLRGNIVMSALGTVVGNPWTLPFIWYWAFLFGSWLLSTPADPEGLPLALNMAFLQTHFLDVMVPMLVGGITTAVFSWFLFFGAIYFLLQRWKNRRKNRQAKKLST